MIYRASVADFQSIYSLVCDLEKTTFIFEAFKRYYEGIMSNPGHVILVYKKHGRIIGMLHIRMEMQLHQLWKNCRNYGTDYRKKLSFARNRKKTYS